MNPDIFLNSAASASDRRTAGILSQIDSGQTLVQKLRDAQMAGRPVKFQIPSSVLLQRDAAVASASGGGYLVGTQRQPIAELIQRESPILRNATLLTGLDSPVTIPYTKTLGSVSWISVEGQTATQSEPTFGEVAFTPKTASSFGVASRQLMLQSVAEQILRMLSSESIARAFETAAIAGTGVAGQPTGVVNAAGVGTQSGSSLAAAGLRAMRKAVLLGGAMESNLLWIGAPDVQETLSGRELTSGGGRLLWDSDGILGRPAIASGLVPAGTLVVGDISRLVVSVFDGQGIEMSFDPFSDFRSGRVGFRLQVPVDFGLLSPAAFSVSTSVT
jgi:HK97 family phage major capsid protein